ncbi:MAG: tetratricopeptide repeat protein, partial [Vicinamibacteria bacterium]
PTHYLLLVGSKEEHAFDWEELLARIEIPGVREDLESIGLANPLRFLSTFLLNDEATRDFVRGSEINRDDRPLLELRAPRSMDRFAGARNLQALLELAETLELSPPIETGHGARQRETVQAKLEPYLRASRHLNRGHVHYQSGLQDFQAAIDRYREAAAANPSQRLAVETLVQATKRTRDELLSAYEAAATEKARSPGVLLNLGLTLLASGDHRRAMEVLENLVEIRPELAEAHVNLSRAALGARERKKALEAAETSVEVAPSRADAHFQKALVLESLERFDDALEAYRETLRLRPEMIEARFNAGTALAALGRLDEARMEYERGLSARPSDDRARMNLARILLLQGDEAAAARELTRVADAGGAAAAEAAEILARLTPPIP